MGDYDPWYEDQMRKIRTDNMINTIKSRDAAKKVPSILNDTTLSKIPSNKEIASYSDSQIDYYLNKYQDAVELINLAWDSLSISEDEKNKLNSIYQSWKSTSKGLQSEKNSRENEREKQKAIGKYDQLVQEMKGTSNEYEFGRLAEQFRLMGNYRDANRLATECENRQRYMRERKAAAIKAKDNVFLFLIIVVFGVSQFILWEYLFLGMGLSDPLYWFIYELFEYGDVYAEILLFLPGLISIVILPIMVGILTLQRQRGQIGKIIIWLNIISIAISVTVFEYRNALNEGIGYSVFNFIFFGIIAIIVSIPGFIMVKRRID